MNSWGKLKTMRTRATSIPTLLSLCELSEIIVFDIIVLMLSQPGYDFKYFFFGDCGVYKRDDLTSDLQF